MNVDAGCDIAAIGAITMSGAINKANFGMTSSPVRNETP